MCFLAVFVLKLFVFNYFCFYTAIPDMRVFVPDSLFFGCLFSLGLDKDIHCKQC